MPEQTGGSIKIRVTGRSAFPGDPLNSYAMVQESRPGFLQRAMSAITGLFLREAPGSAGENKTTDQSLVIKTSPTIWEYEMFRLEWDRRTILREVELMMRADPRIKRANRVFAATAVRKGITVTVTSQVSDQIAERSQETVNEILRVCQVNAKLASWGRILLKDGDLFLSPVVDYGTRKIVAIKRLPAVSMQRCDDMMGGFQDPEKAFRQIDPISLAIIADFPLWAVNHIRWDHEEGERYGNSQYLQLRGYWKKLDMTEQDLVIRRRTRAPQRLFHQVGSKDNPGAWTEIDSYRARNRLDPSKGQIATDYYGNGLTEIKSLEGDGHLDEIEDIGHLQEVYMIGTAVPLHLLGFGKIGAGAEMIETQERQFKGDTQELRDLLEYGDSSRDSGLRSIFDLGLMLQGIDPSTVDYNISWYASDTETAQDRVDRVLKLRSAQPRPLISEKLGLQLIARDVNLENADAIEAEIQQMKDELAEDRAGQETLKEALNPETPPTSPLSRTTVTKGIADAIAGSHLRSDGVSLMERQMARSLRAQSSAVMRGARHQLEALAEKHSHFTDAEHKKQLVNEAVDAVRQALDEHRDARVREILDFYGTMAVEGLETARRDTRRPVTDDVKHGKGWEAAQYSFTNPETAFYLHDKAGTRVRNIDETTLAELRKTLSHAYEDGDEFPAWVERIEAVVDCNVPRGRAEMIARTELAWAYANGLCAGYREIGIDRVRWLSILDNRTCPRCAERHEHVFPLDEVEGHLPLHPRCRCTIVGVWD